MADALMAERMDVPGHSLAVAVPRADPAMAPCQQLAVAVLEQLIADLHGPERAARRDARASVDSGGASRWLDILNLAEPVQDRLGAGLHALAHPPDEIPRVRKNHRRMPVGG